MMTFINLAGLLLIVLIIWWFWLYKPSNVRIVDDNFIITLENGIYSPARIEVEKNKSNTLMFLRKDASPCAELVLFPDLNISETLPINKPFEIKLPPLDEGEYEFSCQMQMYRGVITVK